MCCKFGDGLCNLHVAQELLDYLKQFDTDGKGALSEEELQEVMRGRIGLGTAEKVARGSTDAWLPDEVCLHIEATSCQGATGHSGGASMQRLPNHTKQE